MRKWRGLGPRERRALQTALVLLPVVGLALRVAGFKRVHAWLLPARAAGRPPGQGRPGGSGDLDAARQLARMVDIAGRRGIYQGNCLSRSLVLARLLERHGIPYALRIGVRKNGAALDAHAWLEHGGLPINDSPDVGQRFWPFEGDVANLKGFGG